MKYDDKMMGDFLNALGYLRKLNRSILLTMMKEFPTDDSIFDQKFYELHEDLEKSIIDLDVITDIIRYRVKK